MISPESLFQHNTVKSVLGNIFFFELIILIPLCVWWIHNLHKHKVHTEFYGKEKIDMKAVGQQQIKV